MIKLIKMILMIIGMTTTKTVIIPNAITIEIIILIVSVIAVRVAVIIIIIIYELLR